MRIVWANNVFKFKFQLIKVVRNEVPHMITARDSLTHRSGPIQAQEAEGGKENAIGKH
jgi:hypothetical protein